MTPACAVTWDGRPCGAPLLSPEEFEAGACADCCEGGVRCASCGRAAETEACAACCDRICADCWRDPAWATEDSGPCCDGPFCETCAREHDHVDGYDYWSGDIVEPAACHREGRE